MEVSPPAVLATVMSLVVSTPDDRVRCSAAEYVPRRLCHAEPHLAEPLHRQAHRITRAHELRGDDAPGHDDHALRQALAARCQHVDQPHQGVERMTHDIAAAPLANDCL